MDFRRSLSLLALSAAACSGDTTTPTGDGGVPDTGGGLCLNISGSEMVGGLDIRRPESDANGCRETPGATVEESSCTEIDPDLSCLATTEPLGTPIDVIFTGCVTSFGLEAPSDNLTVTIMRQDNGGAATDPGYDLSGAAGQQAENTPAATLGSVLSVAVTATTCTDRGRFTVQRIPTETPLIARVTDQHEEKSLRQYVDTYQYNLLLRNDRLRVGPSEDAALVTNPETYCAANPCYAVDDVNTVFETTFNTVALTAGVNNIEGRDDLFDGVGAGHIAGQIQDCTSVDTVRNAVVAIDAAVRKLAYFNVAYDDSIANLEDPKVDQTRNRTNADGLYVALAVSTQAGGSAVNIGAAITTSVCGDDGICRCENGAPNPNYTAADTNEGNVEVLGSREIFVFPDSITILTFDRNIYTAE